VRLTVSADTGPSQISQIRWICAWKPASDPPSRAYSDGLVVTPASTPHEAASSISERFAVSRKNFI